MAARRGRGSTAVRVIFSQHAEILQYSTAEKHLQADFMLLIEWMLSIGATSARL